MKDYSALESHTDTEDPTAGMRERTAASVAPQGELTEGNARFRLMADAAPVLIWTCGADAHCTWFNTPWLRFVGRAIEQDLGHGWSENVHPDDLERCLDIYSKSFAAREPFSVEHRLRRHDGEYRWVLNSGTPFFTPRGEFDGYIGSCVDITDSRRAAEAQAYLAAIVDSSDDAIISKNLDGIIQSVNRAAERLFGYSAAELVGQNVRVLIPPERQAEEDQILARIRRRERIDHFETERLAKDGRYLNISLTVSPVLDDAGAIIGVSKIARDITERQAAVAERDRLLEAERAARAEAERASRVKDDFVAMVSHELRTPLNAILSWTQLMMRAHHDPALLERGLTVVARNTRVQAQLISDLLDVSRIVAGKLQLDFQTVDIEAIARDAVETVRHDAESKGIDLRTTLDATPPVSGDPARVQQVIWNLLANAIKFTPQGGRIAVTLRGTNREVEISVADNGAGIRPDFLPHVFDRFHQADRSITRRFGGLGLGLAIVKHLVELHGGTVRAESPGEGQGSTFTVALPASGGSVEPGSRHAATIASNDRWDTVTLDAIRILVVEDEPDTRDFLKRLLEGHGAEIVVAASVTEALSLFKIERPDMLISDIGLPQIDGYDLVQQIRAGDEAAARGIPAIALTAYARAEDRMQALRAGYQVHIAKPVEPGELLAAIASFSGLIGAQRRRR
jgi:PAS domain S-box-containing protein